MMPEARMTTEYDSLADVLYVSTSTPISALNDSHLVWLTEPPKEGMRGLFYDTKS